MLHRLAVVLAGWAVFFTVFILSYVLIPKATGTIPLLLAFVATVLSTPIAYARFTRTKLDT